MAEDRTLKQTAGAQTDSQRLSLQATTPPSEVPGYRLMEFLGAGAFGQVWVGRDLNTGRGVAVKFYLHRGGVNWPLLSREVKNLVQLSADRYVVQVLEVGWDADPPYYVMELIDGGSLEDMLKSRGRLPVDEAVEIFRKICVGLSHCHNKGVLHCDVKPANVLMAEDNEPRLADFGQSRMSHDQAPALGTLFYMAPEQADLESTPEASWDVYAAGAILYQMLSGRPPFRADSLITQIDTAGSLPKRLQRYREAIADQPPPTEQLGRSDVDRHLQRLIAKCLAIEPADRYQNIQQILADLRRREEAQTRKPLMLLGIVGPLLLLIATSIFAVRTINTASKDATEALRTEAFGGNRLAARFAAQTLQTEIERYFALAQSEAERPELRRRLSAVLQDPDLSKTLKEIAESSGDQAEQVRQSARQAIFDVPLRLDLDEILAQQLGRFGIGQTQRPLATMFVTDRYGTIVGIAYAQTVRREENSAVKNFAYRTYFHGGRKDLPKPGPTEGIADIKPLQFTHLSAAFQSTATGLWKVAVSTPIFLTEESTTPDAVFVATINLGDFKLLQSEQRDNQVAVLVDARQGDQRGTVLQHPWMESSGREGRNVVGAKFQIPDDLMSNLLQGGDVDYRDPLAEAEGGEAYAGEWIAAMEPIALPETPEREPTGAIDERGPTTDLLVLVQYRLSKVFTPVGQMRTSLLAEGAAAILAILVVTLTMWYFVRRVASQDLDEVLDPEPGPSGLTETMTARH